MAKSNKINEASSEQTFRSFSEKWKNHPSLSIKQVLDSNSDFQKWLLNRNGFLDLQSAREEFKNYHKILDAGCGNGRVTALLAELAPNAKIIGTDIIDIEIPKMNNKNYANTEFIPSNLREDLKHLGSFDYIYCQEVLHHTGNAKSSFHNLVEILEKNGKIAIYVYRKKAPAREFMDDFIRDAIAPLNYSDAMNVSSKIANLGKKLSKLSMEIEVDDIRELGIVKGKYSVQRFIYHFFLKCYWNHELTDIENAAINFDWYHPADCSRHTLEEVLKWFEEENLEVTWSFADNYGITVHGLKNG